MDVNNILREILKKYPIYPEYLALEKQEFIHDQVFKVLQRVRGNCLAIAVCPYDINEIILKNGFFEWKYEVLESMDDLKHNLDEFDQVMFISYKDHSKWLDSLQEKTSKKVFGLYDELAKQGLRFEQEYYENFINKRDPYADLNLLRRELLKCDLNRKISIIRKIIYLYLEIRDFENAFRYMDEYIQEGYEDFQQIYNLKSALQKLFVEIKEEISKKPKSMVMCWVDSIQFDEMEEMPFLYGERGRTLCFQQAYTVTPNTIPTYFNIFCQKRCVKDELHKYKHDVITSKNSNLMRLLNENGYSFSRHGIALNIFENENCGYGVLMNDLLEKDVIVRKYNEIKNYKELDCKEDICPMVLWKGLRDILLYKKAFVLIHIVAETHTPYICGIYDGEYINDQCHPNIRQIDAARDYVDQQLRFYTGLWNDSITSIMMSDHGKVIEGKRGKVYRDLYHTMLMIKGPKIKTGLCGRMFSYLKFYDLVKWLLFPTDEHWDNLFQDYVEVEDLDKYGVNAITQIISSSKRVGKNSLLGYSGIRTEDKLYIKRNDGKEMYFHFPCLIDQKGLIDEDEIVCFRKMLSSQKRNLDGDFYTYTRVIYRAIEKHGNRMRDLQQKADKLVERLFLSLKNTDVVALRGGGIATNEIIRHVKKMHTVKYIIDNKITNQSGLPRFHYLREDEIENYPINIIIITSYNFRKDMKESLLRDDNKHYKIIDLYQYFKENGLDLTEDYHSDDISSNDIADAYKELLGER